MKRMLFVAATLLVAGPAFASSICKDHPRAEWMSKDAITKIATDRGYDVKAVKEEDQCWEIKGMKDGKRVEIYLDPTSGELVKAK